MTTKNNIIAALYKFTSQRPGLEFANYGDVSAYRSELRSITKDLRHARELLAAVEHDDDITAEHLIKAAGSGRLSVTLEGDKVTLDYCTGQCWPTEYRRAVCAVLASALWDSWRAELPVDAEGKEDALRLRAKRTFSKGVGTRYFQ